MQRHILRQRHRQIKAQGQIGVALFKAVDLLFRFAAALGKQHLGRFNDGGIQRRKAIEAITTAQDLHHALHLLLGTGQQLHKAR